MERANQHTSYLFKNGFTNEKMPTYKINHIKANSTTNSTGFSQSTLHKLWNPSPSSQCSVNVLAEEDTSPIDLESDEELIDISEGDKRDEAKDDYNVKITGKKKNVVETETAVIDQSDQSVSEQSDQIQIESEAVNDKEKLLADYSEYDDNLNAGGIDLSNNNVSGIIESEVETEYE